VDAWAGAYNPPMTRPQRPQRPTSLAAATVLACMLVLQGCAVVRVDEAGRTHVAGLVWLTLPAPKPADKAADVVRARSVGVSVTSGPLGQALTVGYSDQTLAAIRNNSSVRLPRASEPLDGVE
jgi:hypothetical protein